VQLADGRIVDDYFVSVREEVALIVPVTDDGHIILVRQYKHGIGEIVTELPGGFFSEISETAEEAALRELQEETGYKSEAIRKIAVLCDNPTKDTNHLHIFLAENCKKVSSQNLDENEQIEIIKVSADTALQWVKAGTIKTTGSVAGILLTLNR
jgi:ADP-ribose pyrophosphatase YjhB (NUDIX family)